MSDYYYDEDHGIAYKVDSIVTSVVHAGGQDSPEKILVLTDVKVTNMKKEKVRRTLSRMYPSDLYNSETAKQQFSDTLLSQFIDGSRKISEEEYQSIKARFEI